MLSIPTRSDRNSQKLTVCSDGGGSVDSGGGGGGGGGSTAAAATTPAWLEVGVHGAAGPTRRTRAATLQGKDKVIYPKYSKH